MQIRYHCDCHNYEFDSKEECKAHEAKINKRKKVKEDVLSELKQAADILEKYGICSFSWIDDTCYIKIYGAQYLNFCEKFGRDIKTVNCNFEDNNTYLGKCFIEEDE